jgi:hypothetical protein
MFISKHVWSALSVLTNAAVFNNTDKPPVAVAVIQQHHCVALCGIGLTFHGRDKGVQGVNEFEVDILCFS